MIKSVIKFPHSSKTDLHYSPPFPGNISVATKLPAAFLSFYDYSQITSIKPTAAHSNDQTVLTAQKGARNPHTGAPCDTPALTFSVHPPPVQTGRNGTLAHTGSEREQNRTNTNAHANQTTQLSCKLLLAVHTSPPFAFRSCFALTQRATKTQATSTAPRNGKVSWFAAPCPAAPPLCMMVGT